MVISIFIGFSISVSCRDFISGRISTSGIMAELRPLRSCDLRTMVEVDRFCTTDVARTSEKAHGRWYRNRLAI